ncbi:MAG: Crp/Fnr family transcriptional regulator [Rhodospirillales bacterium]|nr:Crp/Fnr family transcriptional regulator [Rhodospirillales bacterium]
MRRTSERAAPAETARSLAHIELFESLPAEELVQLERRCTWQRWNAGEQIIDRETLSNDVYFIVRGRVRVIDYSHSGHREVVFDELSAGAVVGELAAIDGEPRSVNVMAVTETLTASLGAEAFIAIIIEHPKVALAMMRRLSEMIRQSTARIMDLSTLGAHHRIYAELLRIARTGGAARPNQAIIQPMPVHADIAARVSTTRETVARVLSELAHGNVVKREGDALIIRDLEQLTQMVNKFRD